MNSPHEIIAETGYDGFISRQIRLVSLKPSRLIFILLIMSLLIIGICWGAYFENDKSLLQSQLTLEMAAITSNDLDSQELLLSLDEIDFTGHQGNFINLGKRGSIWLKATVIANKLANNLKQRQILVLKKNRIHTPVELHYLSLNEQWVKKIVHASPQFHQNIVIRLPEKMASNTFYLKLQGQYLRTSLYLFDDESFFEDLQLSSFYNGIFFGMLLLFSLYHIMLYLRLKTPSYLAYSVMLLLLAAWFLSGQGWLEYLFPNASYLKNTTVIIGGLLIVAIGEFAKHYLNIKILSRRVYQILVLAQFFLLILLVTRISLHQLLPSSFKQASYALGLLTCLVIFIACLSAAIIGVKKQQTAAGYYLTATLMFFVMATIMGLSAGNIIDFHFSWPLLQMTSAIEIIIFSAGLVSIYYQQQQNEKAIELQLQKTQQKLVKQLEISNQLKDKVLNNVVDHKLFPELAKLTPFLPDIIYVQAIGNESLVVYKKNHQKIKVELACNLQNLVESFGDEYLIRIHKSYLVNPLQSMLLQRRTSADYDLQLDNETVPVGRKYLNEAKKLI